MILYRYRDDYLCYLIHNRYYVWNHNTQSIAPAHYAYDISIMEQL